MMIWGSLNTHFSVGTLVLIGFLLLLLWRSIRICILIDLVLSLLCHATFERIIQFLLCHTNIVQHFQIWQCPQYDGTVTANKKKVVKTSWIRFFAKSVLVYVSATYCGPALSTHGFSSSHSFFKFGNPCKCNKWINYILSMAFLLSRSEANAVHTCK